MKTFIGADKNIIDLFAFKIQIKSYYYNYCKNEAEILSNLNEFDFFPKIIEEGKLIGQNYIIEILTGPNLENILEFLDSGFDIITVVNIGIQLLNILEALHNKGILHNGIKPSNIEYGLFTKGKLINDNKIVLLDYWSSIKYIYGQYTEDEQEISH